MSRYCWDHVYWQLRNRYLQLGAEACRPANVWCMHVHVYDEELGRPPETTVVYQTTPNERRFVGLRIWLESPEALRGNDRSVVTFWAENSDEGFLVLEELCHQMMLQVVEARDMG
jgi:hypothetical protein